MSKRPLTSDDKRVWNRVAKTVRPWEPEEEARPEKPSTEDFSNLFHGRPHKDAPTIRGGHKLKTEELPAAKDPLTQKTYTEAVADRGRERRVRRGQIEFAARLDLHGYTHDSARSALGAFLLHHRTQKVRCVLIITGKGKAGEGVIRRHFFDWLNEDDIRVHVSSFAQAHQKHGGSGAFYVFLRPLHQAG